MTEAEWLASTDPEAMLPVLLQEGGAFQHVWPHVQRTNRRRALFGAACARLVWPLIVVDPRCRRAVESLEDFDRLPTDDELDDIWSDVKTAARHPERGTSVDQLVAANLV